MEPIAVLSRQLAQGRLTSVALTEACLERACDPAGEGARAFTWIDRQGSLAAAERADRDRAAGRVASPLAGIPVSVKALFDVAGQVTTAGSALLRTVAPARADAEAVRRLREAGMVVVGITNMTEFAYSGLGLNPHYGTPGNPADRRRIPGGSSSGAAVSVADGMAAAGLGTDTGGSCRIPAAFCGLTGFKPTARRVPQDGTFPLSKSLDSIGPIARTVECCALVDAALAGEPVSTPSAADLAGRRLAVLENYVTDDVAPEVAAAFGGALRRLEAAGAVLVPITLPDLGKLPELNARGGVIAAEALVLHREWLATREAEYDPRVAVRIRKAEAQGADEYQTLLAERQAMIARAAAVTEPFDAVLMPTVPITAPETAALERDEALFGRINLLALRNPTVANFLDRCAISLPVPVDGLPVGLMLMGKSMGDRRLLSLARGVEKALAA
ncbi:amidase [Amaricoccus sp.]|uniref:amidase n=1 Tax=Amaricoccus sp. TaxID=1872485 RepID=UPI002C846AD3|nr:amidase [Amaricoccus sp.]HRW14289.1 amidase [Amaricoccus sp.]